MSTTSLMIGKRFVATYRKESQLSEVLNPDQKIPRSNLKSKKVKYFTAPNNLNLNADSADSIRCQTLREN